MRFISFFVGLVGFASFNLESQFVNAFTNGTLLPPYLCAPPTVLLPNGKVAPKSLGGVLPYFALKTDNQTTLPNDAGNVFHTQYTLAGYHNNNNGAASTTANTHEMAITVQVNNGLSQNPNLIYPGRDHTLTLVSSPAGNPDANIAIDGALIYAVDQNGHRIGSFVNPGAQMAVFPGCGPLNAGVVHNGLLSNTAINPGNTYTGLVWRAPANLIPATDTVTFKGAAVSDGTTQAATGNMQNGFGAHSTTLLVAQPTDNPLRPPSITKVLLTKTANTAQAALIFFADDNKGSPQLSGQTTGFTVKFALQAAGISNPPITIGINNIPAGQPVAFNVSLTQTVTGTTSPIKIDVGAALANAGLQGGILTVQMTATISTTNTNPNNPPIVSTTAPSNLISFSVGNLKKTVLAQEVLLANNFPTLYMPKPSLTATMASYNIWSLCDQTLQANLNNFGQVFALDFDGACAFMNGDLMLLTNPIPGQGPANSANTLTIRFSLFTAIITTIMAFFLSKSS